MILDISFICSECGWIDGIHALSYGESFCCSKCGSTKYKFYNIRELWNKNKYGLRMTTEEERVYEDALHDWVL